MFNECLVVSLLDFSSKCPSLWQIYLWQIYLIYNMFNDSLHSSVTPKVLGVSIKGCRNMNYNGSKCDILLVP